VLRPHGLDNSFWYLTRNAEGKIVGLALLIGRFSACATRVVAWDIGRLYIGLGI
jgi:hypothetical protein